jgi:hypothetical protein
MIDGNACFAYFNKSWASPEGDPEDVKYLRERALMIRLSEMTEKLISVAERSAHVDQNKVPNNLLVNEPSLSTQGIGGSCGR